MIRILIADDHAIIRNGLKLLFSLTSDIVPVAEAATGPQVLEQLKNPDIDFLLLDLNMPGINGEALIHEIRKTHPELPILILSMHVEAQVAQQVLRAGANGYITKDREPEMLLEAIHRVASGGRFLDPVIAEQLAFTTTGQDKLADHSCLSEREFQVMRLIAQGYGLTEIGVMLSISTKTVSTHKTRLMGKMGFTTNAELMRYAVTHNLD